MHRVALLFEGRTASSMFGDMLTQHSRIGFSGEGVVQDMHYEVYVAAVDTGVIGS